MEKTLSTYGLKMKAVDATEKGRVTILANGLNIEDSQGDISTSGSFAKTLNDFKSGRRNIFHYKNHDRFETIGFIVDGKETATDLVLDSQLNLNKQIGREVFEDYKLAQELGKNIEHSIGVYAIKRDMTDSRKVLEWQLEEVSTLTMRGANPSTGFINLKSINADTDPKAAIDYLRAVLKMRYSDEKLKVFENQLILLEKSMKEKEMRLVQCPHCGLTFDANAVEQHDFEQEVLNTIVSYRRWMTEDIVAEEMAKLEPKLRAEVQRIVGSVEVKNKSEEDIMNLSFVYCPKCYGKVFETSKKEKNVNEKIVVKEGEPSNDTQAQPAAKDDTDWEELRDALK